MDNYLDVIIQISMNKKTTTGRILYSCRPLHIFLIYIYIYIYIYIIIIIIIVIIIIVLFKNTQKQTFGFTINSLKIFDFVKYNRKQS